MNILIFIIILGVLIFVHELGHFMVARRNKVKVEEFGFGFPPRVAGFFINKKKKFQFFQGKEETKSESTVYSLNWIPLGGFVRIKGEDGELANDKDSFAAQSAWTRVKILGAGVMMNFLLAWFLLSLIFLLGAPEAVNDNEIVKNAKVQISQIIPSSPAELSGLNIGDEIIALSSSKESIKKVSSVKEVQTFIQKNKGEKIVLKIKRGNEILEKISVPRAEYPENQGPLGISLARTAVKSYPFYQAIYKGAETVFVLVVAIGQTLADMLKDFSQGRPVGVDISGPIGIAVVTGQAAALGWVYLLQLTAFLSINLGIINILPFPALDGGRILFILIEKIKGSPISQKTEQIVHTIGFALLIFLMIVVTFRDLSRFEVWGKIGNFFML